MGRQTAKPSVENMLISQGWFITHIGYLYSYHKPQSFEFTYCIYLYISYFPTETSRPKTWPVKHMGKASLFWLPQNVMLANKPPHLFVALLGSNKYWDECVYGVLGFDSPSKDIFVLFIFSMICGPTFL